ncbi:Acyl dehydratase [Pseudooceanicola nitratireducens]|jgi:acyl dehydratase|uniref:Acyl dehydratase n=1 Tax=Pseudooceanicola nitratireducens TaxID=517719 RepID=A0A1I1QDT9_9RHOB|nr:MaoC/PaaZ C-terminal domain-containing protein [Pseudooceanicola nitratireducens]MBY6167491.1 MaoC family dehydratase N-terminal domain-containing protein [Pseudooceanicola nitratireducens]MEC7795027.1 MaoC/PaaZ C-terminal domain-containing protein [Pseudomonadota bacterium]SEJ71312.1 Acyl dehydratase [Pseudooceanicola nitratireducens]SFD16300.1 Acyl dehydratase [Pseudooceanicola nitratireducens]
MINYDALMAREFPVIEHQYTAKDSILYALGLGLGVTDPLNPSHLRATYERDPDFAALPAMVNVLGYPGFWAMEPDTGLTWQKILHGEQALTLHAPLPAEGTLVSQLRITGIVDKGEGKGALIYSERDLTDKATGARVATVSSTSFARGDGGFGGPDGPVKPVQPVPEGTPDVTHDFTTPEGAALIYRLSGDLNPLHADPAVAEGAGFKRPILHGLCTLGVASWSITQALADGDFTALTHLELRFTSPVYPGETIRTEMWRDGSDIRFRARVVERDVVVLNNGLARLK